MAEFRSFKGSLVRKGRHSGAEDADSSISSRESQTTSLCAYNLTRERFIGNQVEIGDSSLAVLEARLASLEQRAGAGIALWISPFRDLPVTIVRFPVDLVFLDRDCVVLNTVKSFPIAASLLSDGVVPASALVLPGGALLSAAIQSGDRLILCGPEDMERRLRQRRSETFPPGVVSKVKKESNIPIFGETAVMEDLMESKQNVPDIQVENNGDPVSLESSLEPATSTADSATMDSPAEASSEERLEQFSKKRSWWRRFLAGEPPDPRRSDREAIPGLVAYFFTGGAPVPHNVRDISSNGLYVITEQRWYPNTSVRVTLSDQSEPSRETSLTLYARVARSGRDGVGLQMLLFDQKDVARGKVPPDLDLIVSPAEFEGFVRKFKDSRP